MSDSVGRSELINSSVMDIKCNMYVPAKKRKRILNSILKQKLQKMWLIFSEMVHLYQ